MTDTKYTAKTHEAIPANKHPDNMKGAFYINQRCIGCGAAREVAPDLVSRSGSQFVFTKQPETDAERYQAWRAVLVCPVAAAKYNPKADSVKQKAPVDVFPHELVTGVWRLGYAARSSWGAHSYVAQTEADLVMIDAPRWTRQLVEWMKKQGGISHVLLTHRDDIADAERYAKHFKARVWIHETERDAAPFATDLLSNETKEIVPNLLAIHTPGHTRGSVMFHLSSPPHQEQPIMFGGDTLAWDRTSKQLMCFREACWYSWDVLRSSMKALAESEYRFGHLFSGHGGSVSLNLDQMHCQLQTLVERM